MKVEPFGYLFMLEQSLSAAPSTCNVTAMSLQCHCKDGRFVRRVVVHGGRVQCNENFNIRFLEITGT